MGRRITRSRRAPRGPPGGVETALARGGGRGKGRAKVKVWGCRPGQGCDVVTRHEALSPASTARWPCFLTTEGTCISQLGLLKQNIPHGVAKTTDNRFSQFWRLGRPRPRCIQLWRRARAASWPAEAGVLGLGGTERERWRLLLLSSQQHPGRRAPHPNAVALGLRASTQGSGGTQTSGP